MSTIWHHKVGFRTEIYEHGPIIYHLGHDISLVSALENEAQNLISKHNFNATGYTFDCVGDQAQLGSMIGDHDLVISLLPYTFHPMVAKLAIEKKVNMVTASYLSPGMEELDSAAKSSGEKSRGCRTEQGSGSIRMIRYE